jgi:hypothetical protein
MWELETVLLSVWVYQSHSDCCMVVKVPHVLHYCLLCLCKVMHIGYGNKRVGYTTDCVQLQEVQEETDLGVIVQGNLKCSKQCAKVVGKTNRLSGIIKRTFLVMW